MTFVILQPTLITSTNQITVNPSQDLIDCKMVEIINDSSYAFNLILPGGQQSYMAPQTVKFFAGTDWYGDSIRIFPLQVMAGTWTGLPQKVIVLGFRNNEVTPPDGTVQDINKAVVIGNTVNVSGSMNELQNDNNVAGTPIIEVTTQGQTVSNQTATNDGLWNLGVIIANTIVQFFKSNNIDPILSLGALNHTVEVLGSLTTDQNFTVKGSSSLDNGAITTDGSGDITAAKATLTGAATAFSVTNNATIGGTATIAAATVTGNETVGGTLGVTGVTTLSSNTTVGGTLSVTGASTFTGDATFNGASNGVTVASNAVVTGNVTAGTFTTAGNVSATGNVTGGTLTSTGNVAATGNITGATLTSNGNITAASNATVTGTTTTASIILTGATNKPQIYSDSSGNTNIDVPSGTNVYRLDNAGSIIAMSGKAIGLGNNGTSRNILDTIVSGGTFLKGATSINFQVPTGSTQASITSANLSVVGTLSLAGSTVSFNGNTSGNGIMYSLIDGSGGKWVYIHLNAFNNSGGTNTDVALPTTFAEGAEFFVSNIGQIQVLAGGVAQTFQIITALAAAGGTNTNQTTLNNYSWAHVGGTTIDTIRFSSGIAGSHSGAITMFGR